MADEFKAGSISAFLAQEHGGGNADPKLSALFGNSSAKVFKRVKVDDKVFAKKIVEEACDDEDDSEEEIKVKSKVTKIDKLKKKKVKKIAEENEDLKMLEEDDNPEVTKKEKKKKKKRKGEKEVGQLPVQHNTAIKDEVEDSEEDDEIEDVAMEGIKEEGTEKPIRLSERNAPKEKDPELEARTIFVGNVPGGTKKKILRKLFKECGTVETVRLRGGAPNKPTKLKKVAVNRNELHASKNTLCAYIRFSTREEAEIARNKFRGLMINDNHLSVDLADGSNKKDNKKAIFVGNLHIKLTDEELWRFFEDCGDITSVRIVRDNSTGIGKGFGYVNFVNPESIDIAMKKNEDELRNRSIRISRCVKKVKKDKTKKNTPKKGPLIPPKSKTNAKSGYLRRKAQQTNDNDYSGDKLAEIGKLKRKSNKVNRGDSRKLKFAKILGGGNTDVKSRKKYFK